MKFFKNVIILLIISFVVSTPNKSFAATTIFSDNFGSSYTTLASHVPSTTGTGYTLLINNGVLITVQSYNNHATVTANTSNAGSFYTAEGTYPDADYEISSSVNFAGGDSNYTRSMGLRVQDANNMYLLRYGGSTMIMYKRVSGTWSTIGTASGVSLVGNTSSSPYIGETVSFSAVGTTLTAKVNGVTKLTVTDSSITATGKAGIGLGYVNISTDDVGTGVGIDNVVVQTASADSTAPTVTNISSDKANGSYKAGEVIDIDVTFSETVTSTGNVTVTLETGATDRACTFTVTNASTGTCNYIVQADDTTSDLTVNTVSGTIADQASNAMSDFVPVTNLAANKAIIIDTTAPVISEVTPVATPSSDATPDYTFTTDEAGTISYDGSCTSETTVALSGSNTITFSSLANGIYSDCTITVTDTATNESNIITATSFVIDSDAPILSSISSSVTTTTATITWTTDENSSSSVSYGLTDSYGTTTSETDTAPRITSHSVSISGLTCGTTYNYIVISKDSSNNTSSGTNQTFTTSSCPSNRTSSTSAYLRVQNLINMGNLQKAEEVKQQFPSQFTNMQSQSPLKSTAINQSSFSRNLKFTMVGKDVNQLQILLVSQNKGPAALALKNHGTTNYFGVLTRAALIEFQQYANITPAVGFFGPITREYVANLEL